MRNFLYRLLCVFQIASCINCYADDSNKQTLETVRDAWAQFATASKSVSSVAIVSTAGNFVSRESYLGTHGESGVIVTRLSTEDGTTNATAIIRNEKYVASIICYDWNKSYSYREASGKSWELDEVEMLNECDEKHRDLISSPNLLLIGQNHKLNEIFFSGKFDVETHGLDNGDIRIIAIAIDEGPKTSKMQRCEAVLDSSQCYVLKRLMFSTLEGTHENVYAYRVGGPVPLLRHAAFRAPSGEVFEIQADIEMIGGEAEDHLFTLSHFGLSEPVATE